MLEDSSLIAVTDATFASVVLAAEGPVAVDFWAPWCPSCRPMSKNLEELAGELGDSIVIATINSDENPVTTMAYRVMSLPTLLVFRGGAVVTSVVGARPKSHLRQALTGRSDYANH
jgi:thioredoxin 1